MKSAHERDAHHATSVAFCYRHGICSPPRGCMDVTLPSERPYRVRRTTPLPSDPALVMTATTSVSIEIESQPAVSGSKA